MFKNRFLLVFGLLSLLLVAMSVLEEAERVEQRWAADAARWQAMGKFYADQAAAEHKEAPTYVMDSATRSYIAWGEALEASTVDSATRSYIAQAKAVACGVDAAYGLDVDSATRSYIAWGLSFQSKNEIGALCR